MQFLELAKKRYSVRAYKPDPVEDDKLQQVLEAAILAPAAVNKPPFQLIVIHTTSKETELNRIYSRPWFGQAPLLICAVGIPSQAWLRRDGRSYLDVCVAIAFDHLILAATDLGLGTCWVANFDRDVAREVLGLPEDVEPIVFTPLGYPADQPKEKRRKALPELVKYEKW
ncbi:MAG: nitroreductase family protein [Dehalococcoidales bacterium]|jgi:nitroreductase|nr:nitroreductase family protein [Dehalococcoidales bacterium]MDP6737790.1 nitroreductase family protein [Dehalococcoidales bacterium]|tara:strand:+ start:2465 stop:2974 length:510 start_codon:yes stop_codon:yes gene_type:complete